MNANNDTSETWTASEYHDPPVFLDFTPLRLFITVLNILNLAISLYFLHQHFIFRRKARRGNNSYNYSRDSNASKRHYAPFCLTFQSKFTTQRLLFFSISVIIFLSLSFLFAQHIARYALFLEADSVVVNGKPVVSRLIFDYNLSLF